MPSRRALVTNIAANQLGWFACVCGAAWHLPWQGIAVALAIVAAYVVAFPRPVQMLRLVLAVAALGTVWDTGLSVAGLTTYPYGWAYGSLVPFWITAVWMLFAIMLNVSFRWMRGRFVIAAVFGAVGGPLAWWAGARIGAVVFPSTSAALLAQGLGWCVLMPLLIYLSTRMDSGVALAEPNIEPDIVAADV